MTPFACFAVLYSWIPDSPLMVEGGFVRNDIAGVTFSFEARPRSVSLGIGSERSRRGSA